jgi:RHS repeat-associated protein
LPDQIVTPGLTTTYTYDSSGNPLTKTLTDTTVTPNKTRSWQYSYANFQVASVKTPRTDLDGTTKFGYDASGALTSITNALGQVERITKHRPGGLPRTIVDANGVTTNLIYDARGRILSSAVMTAARSFTTSFAYDAAGNPISARLPGGAMLTSSYDSAHRLTSISDLLGNSINYALDGLGDRTSIQIKDPSNTVTHQHSGAFDGLGRVLQDMGGQAIGGILPTTQYTYDNNGNPLTVSSPLNNVINQAFDPLNRLNQVTQPPPVSGNILTTYDAHDRPLTVTDPNGGVTTYRYDGFGDLIQLISPDSGKTNFSYDLNGNLTRKKDATGAIVNYTYDALNRVLTAKYPTDAAENVTYTYDESGHGFDVGHLTSLTDAAGTLSRSYDERGNILNETRVTLTATLSTSYAYDAANRISSITYPSGATITYARDGMGRVTAISATTPGSTTSTSVLSNIGYEPFGPPKSLTYGNGVGETRNFDLDYRLSTLVDSGSATLQNLTYQYDSDDNVLSVTDGVSPADSQAFQYDVLDRLTNANGGYGNLRYSYDPVGNRLTQTAGSVRTGYVYQPHTNRLSVIRTSTTRQVVGTSPAGDITSFTPALGPVSTLTYNQAGRLATVMGTGPAAQYAYDAFGQRLIKTTPSTTLYGYDLNARLLEERAGSTGVTDYIYLDGRPVATLTPYTKTFAFLMDDRLDTPQLAVDKNQAITWSATYQPFGATTPVGTITQNLRFPGQHADTESGFSYNNARDYAPSLGRYLESDPIGLAGGPNTYAYVGENPGKRIDKSGLGFIDWLLTGKWNPTPEESAAADNGFLYGYRDAAGGEANALTLGRVKGAFGSDTCSREYHQGQIAGGVADASLLAAGGLWLGTEEVLAGGATEIEADSAAIAGSEEALTSGELGQEGEAAVRGTYDIGEKVSIDINGRVRIPDGLTDSTLSEVKNVANQSFTRQLRDYLDFAQQTGRRFDLYLRPSTNVSGPLQDAIDSGLINRIDIP